MDYTNIFVYGYNYIFDQCQFYGLKDKVKQKKLLKMAYLLYRLGYRNKKQIQRRYNVDYMVNKLYHFYNYNYDYDLMSK